MFRKAAVFCLLAAILLTLVSCSAGSSNAVFDRQASKELLGSAEPGYAPEDAGGYSAESKYALHADDEAPVSQTSGTSERKIIWDASMDIEAKDASALHGSAAAYAAQLGGYEYANNIQHYDLYSVVTATFKVPPDKLQDFMAFAGEQGKVVNSKLSSDDITESYYDTQLRLETKRKSLERYYELLKDAEDVEGIVYIQRIIDGITEEIESCEGRLRVWDNLSEMATVNLTIRQENDPVKLQREIDWKTLTFEDMGYLIRSGLVTVCGGLLTVLQWLAVVLVAGSPLWAAALVVIFIAVRRRKKRKAAAFEPQEQTQPGSSSGEDEAP